jgi:hypothetical protein
MYRSRTKYRACTNLHCFLRNTPPHPPTRITSPSPQLVAAHTLPFMHQCTVHAPTPVHAPNCLPCVHQTAFHAVLEPVRPSASVLGVRSDANTYVLLHLRPRVVPALRKTRCAHVYLMSVCVLLCVRSAFACAGAHATPAFRAHNACTCTSVQGLCLHAMPCGRHIQSPCACSPACLLVRIPFGGVCVRQVCTAHLQGTPMSRTCVHCHRASRCAAARRARSRAPGTGPPMCGSGSQFRDFFFLCGRQRPARDGAGSWSARFRVPAGSARFRLPASNAVATHSHTQSVRTRHATAAMRDHARGDLSRRLIVDHRRLCAPNQPPALCAGPQAA